jgi:hypothetical protein
MFEFGFVIGFITALAITGGICWLIGAARIGRVAQALAGGRRRAKSAISAVRVPGVPAVESDVIDALVRMGAPKAAALRALAAARINSPKEFEPLFRSTLATLRKAA